MRKLLSACVMFGTLTGMGLAATWSGTLLDATCSNRHHSAKSCDAKPSTTAFLLESNGTRYRLDSKSNDEARTAMKARADKATNPDATKATPVTATITGRMKSNGHIRAQTIEVR